MLNYWHLTAVLGAAIIQSLIVKQQTRITFNVFVDTKKGKGGSQFCFYCRCASVPLALVKNAFYQTEISPR